MSDFLWLHGLQHARLPCSLFFFTLFFFTILYWFCHTSTWICHRCTSVPNPEPPSHLPPHTISLGHPSAPAPSILYHASNLDWRFISYMILYMFQCHSPISSHPLPLPQSPKVCSIHLCLFCCLAYRVIVTIFLNWSFFQRLDEFSSWTGVPFFLSHHCCSVLISWFFKNVLVVVKPHIA